MLPQAWYEHHHLFASNLPPHCTPTTPFLTDLSSIFHTCVPTPLALTSILLGTLSIVSWLFAQLPQIYKNYNLKSTSGLSIFFLIEWCLGDLSNLFGAILTKQATWQVLVGGYYCFVDSMLVAQWIWYERLQHGQPVRRFRRWRRKRHQDGSGGNGSADMAEVVEGVEPVLSAAAEQDGKDKKQGAHPKDIPIPVEFRTPHYGSFQSTKERLSSGNGNTPNPRTIHRLNNNALPSPSPRTVIFLTFLIALSNASPVPSPSSTNIISSSSSFLEPLSTLGTFLSWTSTLLYLGSRLPQLLKNHSRRSTAGLSPALFLAAFFGNLFYSSSLLLNPLAWHSYPAHGGHGWADSAGSDRAAWIAGAMPFWLGAAGVLVMDAGVGVQFWWFGREKNDVAGVGRDAPDSEEEEVVLVVGRREEGVKGKGRWRWREVDGWMRGWKPSVSGMASPALEPERPSGGEDDALLDGRGEQGEG